MGFRDKVHQAIAAKMTPKEPLGFTVYVVIDDLDRQEAVGSGGAIGTAPEDKWLVAQALRERFFARCPIACVVEDDGTTMRISPFSPDSLQ